jgi:ethanolamine permease
MLEAADALVVGKILQSLSMEVQPLPYIIFCLLLLTYLNYRGAYATLTINSS